MSSDSCSRALGGWLAGCGAATAFLCAFVAVLLAVASVSGGGLMRFVGGAVALLFPALLTFVVTCVLTAIPAAPVIWLSERFQIRSVLFFSCMGAAIGTSSQTLLISTFDWFSWLFVVAGLLAGICHWSIAGKYAGRGRPCVSP